LYAAASSYPVAVLGWSIALQQPLKIWASLHDLICHDATLSKVVVVADHNGNATPADIATNEFHTFLDILRRGHIYVKISALHRRAPGAIERMRDIITSLADAAPERILWGSDWPHVNTTSPDLDPAPHLANVSWRIELDVVRGWLSQEQFSNMLVVNPSRLFA